MIVGTAGHIDHGKSALVKALTGVDTDRLKEEKVRGISIDLGFAYLPLENGEVLGFVDAPGHERFVRNMLAGAAGIDFLLLVVAVDDGIMPQTREHLAIVDLLGVERGLVALTKTDLVDADRVPAVTGQVREALATTGLSGAEILPVSTVTGEGLQALRERILDAARSAAPHGAGGRFRMAVDRCFSLTGAGTVVTGPVISGEVKVGDTMLVSPAGLRARVRSIHAQNRAAERGVAGQRCALNLVGDAVHRGAIGRGDVVLDPVLHAPSDRIDASFRLLAGEARALAHWTPVRLHHGAVEVGARAALLEDAPIAPGGQGRLQLVLERPIAAAAGDRYILRDTSGSRTLGGGRFIDLRPPQRRRRTPQRLAQLEAMAIEAPEAALAALLGRWPWFIEPAAFARDRALIQAPLEGIPHVRIGQVAVSPQTWTRIRESATAALEAFHTAHPDLPGMAIPRLAGLIEPRLPPRIGADAVRALIEAGAVVFEGGAVRTPNHRLSLDAQAEVLWGRIGPLLSAGERFRPPTAAEISALVGAGEAEVRRVLKAMARAGEVVEVAQDRFFRRETVDEIAAITADIAAGGEFSAAQLRDRLNNGRKASIQVLEYFDRQGLTLRRGDLRRINPARVQG